MCSTIFKIASSASCSLLFASFVLVTPGHAAPNLTRAECVQAMESANNYYNLALKNTKLYPTEGHAKVGAQTYFARRIVAEVSQNAKIGIHDDYDEAYEKCRKLLAGDIAKYIGLLGKTAVKGVRGPSTK